MTTQNQWHPDANMTDRFERLKRERKQRCAEGYHDDPDNSGLCIICSAVLYEEGVEMPLLWQDDGDQA